MSTILKTLRKLEEDKNALDQKLDLKGMILKEDVTSEKSIKSDRRKFFLLIAMVTGLLIAGHRVRPNMFSIKHKHNKLSLSKIHLGLALLKGFL